MLDPNVRRLVDAYPATYLACHRQHVCEDGSGALVTEHQASLSDHLHANRPISLSTLAQHVGVGRSAMSIAISRLMRAGYVDRKRSSSDERSTMLTLTAAAQRVKRQHAVLDASLVKALLGLMQPKQLKAALQGSESLARYAKTLRQRESRKNRP